MIELRSHSYKNKWDDDWAQYNVGFMPRLIWPAQRLQRVVDGP